MAKRPASLLILLAGLILAACNGGDQDGIIIEEAWGRPSPKSASNTAFYMAIRNAGQANDALVQAAIDICGATELHRSSSDDAGVMSMRQMQQIDIQAGQTVALEPGGLHIMCIDRQVDLSPGDSVPISLSFVEAGTISVNAEIREE